MIWQWLKKIVCRRQYRREQERNEYVDLCLQLETRQQNRMENLKETIANLIASFSELIARLAQYFRQKKEVECQLAEIDKLVSDKSRKAAAEFDDLLGVTGVSRLEVETGIIRIITEPLALEFEGQKYNLGRFALEIINNSEIRISALDRLGFNKNYDHPQVQDGKINWPVNLRLPVAKLLIGLEYADIAEIAVNLLKSYDRDHCFIPLEKNWKGEPII